MTFPYSGATTGRIVLNAAGTGEIVAAVAGKRIHVLGGILGGSANQILTFRTDDGSGTVIGRVRVGTGSESLPFPPSLPASYMATDEGESLHLTVSTGTTDGILVYALV